MDLASTVVAFTADHGEQLGEDGVFGHGLRLGDRELCVPLALRGPGIEPGAVAGQVATWELGEVLVELATTSPAGALSLEPREDLAVGGLRRSGAGDGFALRRLAEGQPSYAPDEEALRRLQGGELSGPVAPVLDEQTRRALQALGYVD